MKKTKEKIHFLLLSKHYFCLLDKMQRRSETNYVADTPESLLSWVALPLLAPCSAPPPTLSTQRQFPRGTCQGWTKPSLGQGPLEHWAAGRPAGPEGRGPSSGSDAGSWGAAIAYLYRKTYRYNTALLVGANRYQFCLTVWPTLNHLTLWDPNFSCVR